MVNVDDVKNALNMTIHDEVSDIEDVTKAEMKSITKRFTQVMDQLEKDATDDDEDGD
jgi:hypothetical protein